VIQIVIDIETKHGARWFMDGRSQLSSILESVKAEVESVLIMETGIHPITVTGAAIVHTETEFRA
jgi:hypothetical protein